MRNRCVVCGTVLVRQRATRTYCRNACRQSAYRRRRAPRVWHRHKAPRQAHQHTIRQSHGDCQRPVLSLRAAEVRPITWHEAASIIRVYEPMPALATLAFGLFVGDRLACAVAYGPVYGANLRPEDSTIGLLRGASAPWAPANSASKLIRGSMRQLPSRYRIVTAFSDATQGERGVVYRAAGFVEQGASLGGRRILVHYRGKVLSERTARRKFGTSSASRLAALGLKVETVPRRCRYVAAR